MELVGVDNLRSRIKENFSIKLLEKLLDIKDSTHFEGNNDKVDYILHILKSLEFIELGPGTNRLAVLKDDYVYKIALDDDGVRDNWNEYNQSMGLQPYATKTYESNGIISVAEYVSLITPEEFELNKIVIKEILSIIAEDYIFADLGIIKKNFANWGYRDDGSLVMLDYGYIYRKNPYIMFCESCSEKLEYDENFHKILCIKCGRIHNALDIKERQNTPEHILLERYQKAKNASITIGNSKK